MKGSEKRKRYPGEQKFPLWELHRYNVPQSAPNFSPSGMKLRGRLEKGLVLFLKASVLFVLFLFFW